MAPSRRLSPLLLVTVAGCFGSKLPPANDDASYGRGPDLAPLCSGNHDGVIGRDELAFPVGMAVRYLFNPPGTTLTMSTDGTTGVDGAEYDLTSQAGELRELRLERVDDQWFGPAFPTATYAVLSDFATETLGLYRVADEGLYLLGFASRQTDTTLLVYNPPVLSLRFPVQKGDAWVALGKITGGRLGGKPFASTDTYRVTVDQQAAVVLPYLRFTGSLRVRVEVTQALPAGVTVVRQQKILFHECYGELGRLVSNPGELDPAFTTVAEFRRLAL